MALRCETNMKLSKMPALLEAEVYFYQLFMFDWVSNTFCGLSISFTGRFCNFFCKVEDQSWAHSTLVDATPLSIPICGFLQRLNKHLLKAADSPGAELTFRPNVLYYISISERGLKGTPCDLLKSGHLFCTLLSLETKPLW